MRPDPAAAMTAETLLIDDVEPGIRLLTLNRPGKRNAIDQHLFTALIEAFDELDRAGSVRVAILTGADPAFCAGVDLADASDRALLEERRRTGISPPSVLASVQTPVIAAVNGPCVAGGLELALACDLVLAARGASFADTHVQLGLLPSWGGAALLPAAVGTRRAKEIALTGRFVTAEEAFDFGLVTQVVDAPDLRACALALARRIAAAPPEKVRALLHIYDAGEGLDCSQRLELERRVLLGSVLDVSGAADRLRELAGGGEF